MDEISNKSSQIQLEGKPKLLPNLKQTNNKEVQMTPRKVNDLEIQVEVEQSDKEI